MNIGIVSTWFERGAAYVSKQFEQTLEGQGAKIFIYARGGESYATGNPDWDCPNVYWQKERSFVTSYVCKSEFLKWLKQNSIELVLFNEQHYWQAIIWAKQAGVKTSAYIDYYTQETVPLYNLCDAVIVNTQRHKSVFSQHPHVIHIPWGTTTDDFSMQKREVDKVHFFHSCGMSPHRKGTDMIIKAVSKIKDKPFKLIVHSQVDLVSKMPELKGEIECLLDNGLLEVVEETITKPGLYHLGDVYVYPSRLEGIGLTIAEAISCGLPVVVPDNGPMNEFATPESKVVEIEKFISRADGYYWPECIVSVENLEQCLEGYLKVNLPEWAEIREATRQFAIENFDWDKNSANLFSQLKQVELQPPNELILQKANVIDNRGRPLFTKFPRLYNTLYNFLK